MQRRIVGCGRLKIAVFIGEHACFTRRILGFTDVDRHPLPCRVGGLDKPLTVDRDDTVAVAVNLRLTVAAVIGAARRTAAVRAGIAARL